MALIEVKPDIWINSEHVSRIEKFENNYFIWINGQSPFLQIGEIPANLLKNQHNCIPLTKED